MWYCSHLHFRHAGPVKTGTAIHFHFPLSIQVRCKIDIQKQFSKSVTVMFKKKDVLFLHQSANTIKVLAYSVHAVIFNCGDDIQKRLVHELQVVCRTNT